MAYTINRRLGELIDSTGQLNDGKIPNDYINGDHIADNTITTSMLHTTFSVPAASLTGIDTDDVSEGATNVYYTDARARGAISVSGSLSYDSGTGVVTYTTPTTIASLSNHTTDNLSEGSTNLYYTTARFDTAFSGKSTTDLSEGGNLYYTDARVGSYLTANSYATQSYVSTAISNLVDSSPATLDTLNELAAALGDDPNFATTVSTNIGTKVSKSGDTMTGTLNGTNFISGGGTPTGSVIGGVRAYGATQAYMCAADESGRTAFFGVDSSGYAMFGALTNHDTVIRANNVEYLRVKANSNVNIVSGALEIGGTTVIDSSRNLSNIGTLSSGVITAEGASGGKNLVYASNFAASGAGIQLTLERTTDATGWGGIGADADYCFSAWGGSGGVTRRFGIGQSGNANLLYGDYQVNGTTVIDSSRNLTNIGDITAQGVVATYGGARIVIQNSVDGGNSRGIFMWNSSDSNWGIYMSQYGSGKSLSGATAPAGLNGETSHHIRFRVASGSTNGFIWENNNNVARMSLNASSGSLYATGNVTAYASDARLKKNVTTITGALEKVQQLRGVEFDWKDECESLGFVPSMKHETGVIAQEVQAVIPDAAVPAPFNNDYLTVHKDKIVPLLIEAIKELKAEVDSLKAELAEK